MTAVLVEQESGFGAELAGFVRERFGPGARITEMDRRGEGWSWETYLVAVETASGTVRLAVKREPADGILGSYDVGLEVALLETAAAIGIPVPAVYGSRTGARDFYVMERVPGSVPMPWDVRKRIPDLDRRRALGTEIASIMARLHTADIRAMRLPPLEIPTDAAATGAEEAARWRRVYEENRTVRIPLIDLALAWLEARADHVSGRLALVHNDLRIGNVIVDGDGSVAAVLDWETARFTDPAADLAKFDIPTFRGRSPLAGQVIEMERYLAAYADLTGWRPEERALRYWTCMELTKGIIGSIKASKSFERGTTADVRYLNMAYQMHHALRWLLETLRDGEWGD
ncbi:phosphotransferase family protein [Pseudonocardia pini]|uniref:phosphotransferase family protein n=1 Tax=Pseudonocardia pini TaxID=2758030 RepID=UPI0015F03254|nr:phosphotransferase family protein [Pseudonocardia pini]